VSLASPGNDNRSIEITDDAIREVVLTAMRNANEARDAGSQLVVAADAPIFGPDSSLDSLGLVGLLLDIEEGLQAIGCEVVLSDERAVSQKRSPFRSVQSLVSYVGTLARE
jgi:acyl carrier protein